MYDLTFIGCGTANTFALISLIQKGYKGKIAVIEAGKDIYNRDRKEVMKGFLGAGLYSDAKIILSTTTGGNIEQYIDGEDLIQLDYQFFKILREFHKKELNIIVPKINDLNKYKPFEVLINKTLHLGSEYGEAFGKKVYDYIKQQPNIDFFFESEVHDIIKEYNYIEKSNNYIIRYQSTIRYSPSFLDTKKIVIGAGKSGIKFLNKFTNDFNITTTESEPNIGVRVEVPYNITKELTNLFYDFKLLLTHPNYNITARSFCVSPKGMVITENTYDMVTYNGGSYKDKEKQTNKTNFGIMCTPNIPKEYKSAFEFQKSIVEKAQLNKYLAYTQIIADEWFNQQEKLETIFTEPIYQTLTYWMENFNKITDGHFLPNVVICIPEVKYVGQKIKLEKDLSLTNYKDIYIVGDVAGISRGIYQAVLSGLHVANSLI